MLPWLWLSMQMDPGNVETFRVAAFWMAGPINRPDLALRVLRDARRIHPHNYQLLLDSGRILLRHGDRGGARRAFDAALALWPKHTGEDEELARFEKAELLTFKALLCEMDNQPDQVRELLKEVLVLFPGRDVVRRRLAAMERGEPPEVPAVRLWSQMLLRHGKSMENCGRAGDAHAHGPAEDDPHR
jgi:tetratricopeptide (TPR) repeat protein